VIRDNAFGAEHPYVASGLDMYASLLREMDRCAEADESEIRASTIRMKYSPSDPSG
jgi:hypothetical protein